MRRTSLLVVLLASLTLGSVCFAGPIPATFFGMHVNQSNVSWSTVGFGSYRLWDDGTAWANINTRNGVYNWSPLDSWVSKAQQQNVQLLYTFGRTPGWASSSPNTSCNYAAGACVAPSSYAYWDSYVTAIATRYKGKIKYYEMWNEPNDAGYWKGTTDQMVEMTRRAANIIHSIDPNAEVVSPGATWSSTTAWAWLDGFLSAGGGTYLDDIGFHGYSGNKRAETIFTIVDNIQKVQAAHGYSLPLMITEGGWGTNSIIPDEAAQAAFLVQRYMLVLAGPAVKSFFWYQWDSPTWGTLWDSTNGTHPAGVAYSQLTGWLTGATANGCTEDASLTWTCAFTLAKGNPALAVWNAAASAAYTPGAQYDQVLAIDGSSRSINGSSAYTIGNAPVLFTASTAALPTATLSVTPSTGIAPVVVSASVSATVASGLSVQSTSISFDDGTIVNASSGSHNYASPGTYTVLATVTDSLNRSATSSKTVTVNANQPPQAALSVSPATGKAPLAVSASTASSKDTDGSIASSSIDFGDGTVVSGTTATHTYTAAGTYTLRATVKDNLGASSTATVTANAVANQPPAAKLTLTQSGATVTASTAGSTDPDGTIVSTVINWGDGVSTNATSGSHTYTTSGTYTVTATVTDDSGASASASQSASVRINKAPVAVMTLTQTAAVSYKVLATASYDPDGTIASTVINWGDGSTTAATSGSHTYSTPGTYNVTVTVTDNDGASSSTTGTATAYWGIFVVSPASGSTVGSPVHFTAQVASHYGISSVAILVDGKTVYSSPSWLINTYVTMASGSHKIIVQATDGAGIKYQSSFSITVQ
jgi:PKD repeat protein